MGETSRKQAATINPVLHKIDIKDPLDFTNYHSWAENIEFGLAEASYDDHLPSTEEDGIKVS